MINTIFWVLGMEHVISELCYKGAALQWSFKKMTITWSFLYIGHYSCMAKIQRRSHSVFILHPTCLRNPTLEVNNFYYRGLI